MTKAAFMKQNGALWPCDADGRDVLAAMKEDRQVMIIVHAARRPRHHRLLFHLIRRICASGAWEGDEESLLTWLKIGTHLVDTVIGPDGKTYYVPKSISFESMPQDKFARWFDRAVWLICTRLLGRDDWRWLVDEINAAVDGGITERARKAA